MKFRPVGAELFQADRRTDMTEPIFRFSEFCERAKQKLSSDINSGKRALHTMRLT